MGYCSTKLLPFTHHFTNSTMYVYTTYNITTLKLTNHYWITLIDLTDQNFCWIKPCKIDVLKKEGLGLSSQALRNRRMNGCRRQISQGCLSKFKSWIYQHRPLQRLTWPLTVYEIQCLWLWLKEWNEKCSIPPSFTVRELYIWSGQSTVFCGGGVKGSQVQGGDETNSSAMLHRQHSQVGSTCHCKVLRV